MKENSNTVNNTNIDGVVLQMNVDEETECRFSSHVENAIVLANDELTEMEETINSIKGLKPECDKLDYILAVSSGTLCGIIDIFLVGKPGKSKLGHATDEWCESRIYDFAKLCGWKPKDETKNKVASAKRYIEKKFKVPYDQTGIGDAAKDVFGLSTTNHHFKSLGHNPTLLGLFFSILNQFTNTSSFVTNGELISLQEADDKFELKGNTVIGKIISGFVNWFGHLLSDVSGSSGSKGRGTGVPATFLTWANDIIVIKRKLKIEPKEFDKNLNELALKIYKKGFDARFQAAQAIPVFINEVIVRLMYSVRRVIKYYSNTKKEDRSFKSLWIECNPFANSTVKRMLTVAHGTFCLLDIGDATVHSLIEGKGTIELDEFFLRLNVAGIGRLTVSLYGEARREIIYLQKKNEVEYTVKKKHLVESYIEGLKILSEVYDDRKLINFIKDLKDSELYITAFDKTVDLAKKRSVPDNKILKNKDGVDEYFGGRN